MYACVYEDILKKKIRWCQKKAENAFLTPPTAAADACLRVSRPDT